MFKKRKIKAGKAYAHRMLLSFTMSEAYDIKTFMMSKKCFTSHWTTVSVMKQLSSDIILFFSEHCPMFRAKIQAGHY